ncbi:hypothetical protein DM01DRAFT_1391166, partial [Hesseltinella vesiculosa]
MYDVLTKQLPDMPNFISPRKYGRLIKDNDFGKRASKRVEKNVIKGRMLYKLRDNAMGCLVESTSAFRAEMKNEDNNWINIGYVRKSPVNESVATRQRLHEAKNKLHRRLVSCYFFFTT